MMEGPYSKLPRSFSMIYVWKTAESSKHYPYLSLILQETLDLLGHVAQVVEPSEQFLLYTVLTEESIEPRSILAHFHFFMYSTKQRTCPG